jgi:hypothetical protein
MKITDLGLEKKMVLFSFLFLFVTFTATGFLMERTIVPKDVAFSGDLPVGYSSLSSASTAPSKIRAEVKGSIYETGSNMTVFGACFDGNSYLLPDATTTFTAWYPNGTMMLGPNATMFPVGAQITTAVGSVSSGVVATANAYPPAIGTASNQNISYLTSPVTVTAGELIHIMANVTFTKISGGPPFNAVFRVMDTTTATQVAEITVTDPVPGTVGVLDAYYAIATPGQHDFVLQFKSGTSFSAMREDNGTFIITQGSANSTGRWGIHVTMGDTIGTYLTEMRCTYGSEYALAFGEWQNPEWVKRIGDTQASVNTTMNLLSNFSNNFTVFQNSTANSFSTIMSSLSGLTGSGSNAGQITELENALASLDKSRWVLDETSPFFVLASNVHNYTAVDMLAKNSVAAVSSDGYFDMWDGVTWSEFSQPTISFTGVSILPSNTVYAWGVGSQGGSAVYSVNGANASTVACGSPTGYNDVRLYQTPNTPSAPFKAYLLGNDGSVCFSNDGASTWSLIGTIGAGSTGRISQVVDNSGPGAQPNGYATLIGQGSDVMFDNGVTQTTYTVNGTVKDVGLKYSELGYVVAEGASESYVYQFNGTGLNLVYTIADSNVIPTAVHVIDSSDVWVSTVDPSVLYHYDGHAWEYSGFGVTNLVSVVISFGNVSGGSGIHDVAMSDSRSGYAVGSDGMILVMQSTSEKQYAQVISQLNLLNASLYAINSSISGDISSMNGNLTNVMYAVNSSMASLLQNLNVTLNLTNVALQTSMDAYYINLTAQIDGVNQTVSTVASDLLLINSSLSGQISALDLSTGAYYTNLTSQINGVSTQITDMNASVLSQMNSINASLSAQLSQADVYQLAYYTNLSAQLSATNSSLDAKMDAINASLDAQIQLTGGNIMSYLSAMNASIVGQLTNMQVFLDGMNSSLQFKTDNILNNVTYTQLYIETTLTPMMNATYQNTVLILQNLGILSAQVNQTIQLQNSTLQIVNATDQKVDQLINKSNRIRVWVTQ